MKEGDGGAGGVAGDPAVELHLKHKSRNSQGRRRASNSKFSNSARCQESPLEPNSTCLRSMPKQAHARVRACVLSSSESAAVSPQRQLKYPKLSPFICSSHLDHANVALLN